MSNLFSLKGKVAIVTGASSGLGVQFARALAREGADLAICARRLEKLQQVKTICEAEGVKCLPVKLDVTDNDQIKAAVKAVLDEYGTIDILVNNAGIGLFEPAESESDSTWETMMKMNLSSYFYMSREVAQTMIKNHYGKIINIGSIHSTVAMTGMPLNAYATTKGGVLMLTKALAVEWAKHGITVNAIGPAYFASEMTENVVGDSAFQKVVEAYCPMGRVGAEGELDGAVVYFASDASRYTTGQLLSVDGGWTAI